MKTTVEISDELLREVKRMALRKRTTVRALIEQGLRLVIRDQEGKARGFSLRDASFTGDGLLPGRSLENWETIRDRAYAERGA